MHPDLEISTIQQPDQSDPADLSAQVQHPDRPRLTSGRKLRRDIIETVLLVIVIYTLVNLTTARAIVEGPSMQPNFYTGQLVVINVFAYYYASPQRGDVVVLHNPRADCQTKIGQPGCEDLIKRVIGLPNETVTITKGVVAINDTPISEPYVKDLCHMGCDGTWTLTADQYFVLGDNRNNSYDGHSFGPIARGLIVGQAWIRYWPPQDANVIPHPVYSPAPTSQLPPMIKRLGQQE